ncbi:hypothetical protein VTO42DRAFT_2169 [Malbranchea cinnamomea]
MTKPSSNSPLTGLWQPQFNLENLYYGPNCVQEHLLEVLPSASSKVFIITGHSIATKTPLVNQVEALLGIRHAGTFSNIKQHGLVAEVDQATAMVENDPSIDTLLSIGGGSPIDAAKTICFRLHQKTGKWLTHITIPTTLSAAECTAGGGYTNSDGVKVGFTAPEMGVSSIFYDPSYSRYTPPKLWLATGMRAIDHAVETCYHPYATEMPWKAMARWALATLFENLPLVKASQPADDEIITRLHLAAFASLGFRGKNVKGGMGLSHSLGHALGSPYGIPHGETSCLTLGHVVMFKAHGDPGAAEQIARLLPAIGGNPSGDDLEDALEVGRRIVQLVSVLGLSQSLTQRGIGRDQIPIIVERATRGANEGQRYDAIARLIEGLF